MTRQLHRTDPKRRRPSAVVTGLFAATLLAAVPGGGPAQGAEPGTELVAVSEPCLNLRPGPGLDAAPVRCLPPGRRMTLLESRGDWGRVRLPDDQVGWVALSLVKPVAEGVAPAEPAAPKSAPPRPRPEPPRAEQEQPEPPRTEPRPEPEPRKSAPPKPGTEREASMTALAESEGAARRRVRELEAEETKWREEVDDLTGLLRAAEMFLSESEKQRLDLARQVAALQEENQALRARLGEEAPAETAPPAGEPADAGADPRSETAASGVLLPEAPLDPADSEAAAGEAPAAEPAEEEAGAESETGATSVPPPEAPVAAPSPAGEPSPPEGPETSELMQTVTAWARAWSEQRVDDYLSYYASSFQPPGGMTRAAWEAQRRQRVSAPGRIQVKVALRDVRAEGPDRAELELLQSYSSDSFSDQVVKTLELVLESGAWKIARESSR